MLGGTSKLDPTTKIEAAERAIPAMVMAEVRRHYPDATRIDLQVDGGLGTPWCSLGGQGAGSSSYGYTPAAQVAFGPGGAYTYDAAGNLTSRPAAVASGQSTYNGFDAAGQVCYSATASTGPSGS